MKTHTPRLRRSRSVHSPRVRSLRRAMDRGADPMQAVYQWIDVGGSMARLAALAGGK